MPVAASPELLATREHQRQAQHRQDPPAVWVTPDVARGVCAAVAARTPVGRGHDVVGSNSSIRLPAGSSTRI